MLTTANHDCIQRTWNNLKLGQHAPSGTMKGSNRKKEALLLVAKAHERGAAGFRLSTE